MIPIETVAELGTCLLHLMCDRERTRNDKHVLVSLGEEGVLRASYNGGKITTMHHCLGELKVSPQVMREYGLNTNGCGDVFCAGVALELARCEGSLEQMAIEKGMEAAYKRIMNGR